MRNEQRLPSPGGFYSCPGTSCWKDCRFLSEQYWHLLGSQLISESVSGFHSVPLVFWSVCRSLPYCFDCHNFIECFEVRWYEFSSFILLFKNKIGLPILGSLQFYINFRLTWSFLPKRLLKSWWDCVKSIYRSIWRKFDVLIFTISIHNNGIYLPFLRSSFMSFSKAL